MKHTCLIAFDMDGTLLNKKKTISLRTLFYLRKLTRQGHKIVLASGRPSRALTNYYKQLHLSTPLICYNGAYCFSPSDKDFPIHEFEFPKEIIKSLIKELKPYMHNVMCETDTEIWIDQEDQYLAKFFWYGKMHIHYGDLTQILDKNPMTMIVQMKENCTATKEIEAIVSKYPEISVRFWTGSPYFELFFKQTSKGASIEEIAKYYDIDQNHIIVFGDAENDIEMFHGAGTAVAMKNGKESLKDHATIVTEKDNDHNGIYHTLKKILKNLA